MTNGISSLRHYFHTHANHYLSSNLFTPWCIGFFFISGSIGYHRARRFLYLLSIASDEGVLFLFDALMQTTSRKLNNEIQGNKNMMALFERLNNSYQKNEVYYTARSVFTDILNVNNIDLDDYKDETREFIQHFSYASLNTAEQKQRIQAIRQKMDTQNAITALQFRHS